VGSQVFCVRCSPAWWNTLDLLAWPRANGRLKFDKRCQYFIRTSNETLSVVAMRVSNPDRSPVGINRRNTAPTPTGFAEIVSDDLAVITRTMFDILSTICQDAQACGDVDSAS
jgi:hypothetical protein